MAPVLTAEDVVRRIATECAFVDERGGVGISLEPAAAIVRPYGEQFRRGPRRKQVRPPGQGPSPAVICCPWADRFQPPRGFFIMRGSYL